MGSLVKGVLPSQEGGLGAKAGEQQTETVVARGLLNDQPDSGVVCRFYTQCDETNKTGNGLNVSVCDDVELVCQFCKQTNGANNGQNSQRQMGSTTAAYRWSL